MRNDEDLAHDVELGAEANSLLSNELFKMAFISIKADLVNGFEDTSSDQSSERDEIWRKLQSLNWLQDKLTNWVQSGKMSAKELEVRSKNH